MKVYEWLKEVDKFTLTNAIYNMDAAYKKFFRKHTGYPKFKRSMIIISHTQQILQMEIYQDKNILCQQPDMLCLWVSGTKDLSAGSPLALGNG